MTSKATFLSALACGLMLAGCGSIAPVPSAFQARAPLAAIDTDQSAGLRCLGRLIDTAPRGPVELVVGRIRDRTVPKRFEDRRLSKGGAWWVHTAVAKLGSRKVSTLEAGSKQGRSGTRQLLFEGAWTQDDRVGVEGSAAFGAVIGNVAFSLFGDLEYDLIVGDFTTARDGRVTYASAVGAVIGAGSGDSEFFIRDGLDSYAFDIGAGVTEGPQMAQRQITESAVAAHLAAHYGVNLRPCLEVRGRDHIAAATNEPGSERYDQLSPRQRNLALQQSLRTLGHYDGKLDGIWGPQSAAALRRFASQNRLPPSDRPTSALYQAAREAAARRGRPS